MTYRDPRITCQPWITASDLCCAGTQTVDDCVDGVTNLQYIWSDDDLIQAASDLLFARTCYNYPGECTQTVWPCLGCGNCNYHPCKCGSYHAILLQSDFPVLSVDEISIDGVIVDPALYRLDENATVVRLDDEPWPACNNLGITAGPSTSGEELLVTYTSGRNPPAALKMAAAELVCELKKACNGDSSCNLPSHVRNITRRGTEMELDSIFSLLDSGLTGNPIIDHALSVYGNCPKSSMWDPAQQTGCGQMVVKTKVVAPEPDDSNTVKLIDETDSPYLLLDSDDYILVDSCSAVVDVVLPPNHALDKTYEIKRLCCGGGFDVNVYSSDGDAIDELPGYVLNTACMSITLISDSEDWWSV